MKSAGWSWRETKREEYYLGFIAQWSSYLTLDLHFNSNVSLQGCNWILWLENNFKGSCNTGKIRVTYCSVVCWKDKMGCSNCFSENKNKKVILHSYNVEWTPNTQQRFSCHVSLHCISKPPTWNKKSADVFSWQSSLLPRSAFKDCTLWPLCTFRSPHQRKTWTKQKKTNQKQE